MSCKPSGVTCELAGGALEVNWQLEEGVIDY